MKRSLFLGILAWVLQAGVALGLCLLAEAAYRSPRRISEAWELPLTDLGLIVAGPLAAACAAWATFRILQRVRPSFAVPLVGLLCVPPLFAGVLATFALCCVKGLC